MLKGRYIQVHVYLLIVQSLPCDCPQACTRVYNKVKSKLKPWVKSIKITVDNVVANSESQLKPEAKSSNIMMVSYILNSPHVGY